MPKIDSGRVRIRAIRTSEKVITEREADENSLRKFSK
jgi:hypothetical protein